VTTPEELSESPELNDAPPMSLAARLANIFVAPGEVFDSVKVSPPAMANWIVPLSLSIVVAFIYTMVVFSQPTILQAMRMPVEKKFQQMVDSGKLTRQQADQQLEMVEKFMSEQVLKIFGILGSAIMLPIVLFVMALVVWLVGKYALGGNFPYMKAVEAVGLASTVTIPCGLLAMLLAVIYGNIGMTASPILLVGHFDSASRLDRVLSTLDIGSIWSLTVLSIALSRFTGRSFVVSAIWGFGIWAVIRVGPAVIFGGGQ
jgi:hypothetical protein